MLSNRLLSTGNSSRLCGGARDYSFPQTPESSTRGFTQRRTGSNQNSTSPPAIGWLRTLAAATMLLAFGCLLSYQRSDPQTRQTRRPSRTAPADVIYSFQLSPDRRTLA